MTDKSDRLHIWWKKLFVVSAGVSAGITFAAIVAAVAFFWYSNLPVKARPWNQTAITAKFTDLYLTTGQPLILTFRYTLENHTNHDYELPGNESIYQVLTDGKGLDRDATLKWEDRTTIVAGQKINVGIHVEYDYSAEGTDLDEKLTAFTARRLADIDGFAALDQVNRYEIKFPMPPKIKP